MDSLDAAEALPPPTSPYSGAWAEVLVLRDAYRLIVIRDVDPDEALRRLGADDDQISTSTWRELLQRASAEDVDPMESEVAAAFALGPHALVVEPFGWFPLDAARLAPGTVAVTSSRTRDADPSFDVFKNGLSLAALTQAGAADGAESDVVLAALAEVGIDEPEDFDEDQFERPDNLELLCRIAGVRPTLEDAIGPARVAIFPVGCNRLRPAAGG